MYDAREGRDEGSDALLDEKNRELARKVRNSGRRVARDAAVIPIPGSTVDQIATSVAANKKSLCTRSPMNLRRIILATEPLIHIRLVFFSKSEIGTHTAPRARTIMTVILVRGFMSRSLTIQIGSNPKVQSAHALRAV